MYQKGTNSVKMQYECIKSGLKDDYEKRAMLLNKKLVKKAETDPSLLLLDQIT